MIMQEKRKTDEYIFCSVQFGEDSKSYYYLADDDIFAIGDFVIVPVGDDGHSAIVEIVNIEYFQEDKVPFPIDKVKTITRKCSATDFEVYRKSGIYENVSVERDKKDHIMEKQPDNEDVSVMSERFVLCNEKTSRVKVNVGAEISEGCLTIAGQDLGQAVTDVFGESEYEYYYEFDQQNTERLFNLLKTERQSVNEVLTQKFGGMDGCRRMREFCEANNIKYSFFSY